MAYVQLMTKPSPVAESVETDDERQRRVAWEAERIAEARAELDAGRYVDAADVRAWVDRIGTDNELPPPPLRQR
jgi:predicted transcriptional regulator